MKKAINEAAKNSKNQAVITTTKVACKDKPIQEFLKEIEALGWETSWSQNFHPSKLELSVTFNDNYKTYLNQRPFIE